MKMPTMIPVKSSNVQEVGHSDAAGLFVRFNGGGLFQYPDAPKHVFNEIVQSDSPGRAFQQHVRGKYIHKKHDA